MPAPVAATTQVLQDLHKHVSDAFTAGLAASTPEALAVSFSFAEALRVWAKVIVPHGPAGKALRDAADEIIHGLLALHQAQYVGAFRSLRSVLELGCHATQISTDLIAGYQWDCGKRDISWASIVDSDSGVLGKDYATVFFPELSPNIASYNSIARELYRELSEAVHGNAKWLPPSAAKIAFDESIAALWFSKAEITRNVVIFSLIVRHLSNISEPGLRQVEPHVRSTFGYLPQIVSIFDQRGV